MWFLRGRREVRTLTETLTNTRGPGFWFDLHFIDGTTRRLFYPYTNDDSSVSGADVALINLASRLQYEASELPVSLYTTDNRQFCIISSKAVAAIEVPDTAKDVENTQ